MSRNLQPRIRRVLIVDRSHEVLEQIRVTLRAWDPAISLSVACSIEDAREFLLKTTPDMVIATADWVDDNSAKGSGAGIRWNYPVIALVDDRHRYDEQDMRGVFDYAIRTEAGIAELPLLVTRSLREWALVRRNEQLMKSIDISPDFVGAADPDGRMLFANNGGRRMVDLDDDEDITGRRLHELFPGWSVGMIIADTLPAVRQASSDEDTLEPVHFEHQDARVTVSAHLSTTGEIEFFSVYATRKTNGVNDNESQRKRRLETIGKLAAGIAHDVNNTLVPIIGQAELAIDEAPDDDKLRDRLSVILRAADQTKELAQQIVSLGSPSPTQFKRVRAEVLIREATRIVKTALPQTIRFHEDLPKKCGTVLADTPQIYQLVVSLCLRSIESIAGQGTLSVSLEHAFVEKDSRLFGRGLEPGHYAQLTIRESVGPASTPSSPPAPLSDQDTLSDGVLNEARRIVASHNGMMFGHGYPGGRAAIVVYLPIVDDNGETADRSTLPGNKKILVVDDEGTITKTIEQLLQRDGYQVTAKTNPVDALQLFCTNPERFDLVITDRELRSLGGEQLATLIRRVRLDVPIIETSAYNNSPTNQPRGFLQKPFSAIELREALHSAFTI